MEELQEIAERYDCQNIEELQDHVDFGWSCGTCIPYVDYMLRTGKIPKCAKDLEDEDL